MTEPAKIEENSINTSDKIPDFGQSWKSFEARQPENASKPMTTEGGRSFENLEHAECALEGLHQDYKNAFDAGKSGEYVEKHKAEMQDIRNAVSEKTGQRIPLGVELEDYPNLHEFARPLPATAKSEKSNTDFELVDQANAPDENGKVNPKDGGNVSGSMDNSKIPIGDKKTKRLEIEFNKPSPPSNSGEEKSKTEDNPANQNNKTQSNSADNKIGQAVDVLRNSGVAYTDNGKPTGSTQNVGEITVGAPKNSVGAALYT